MFINDLATFEIFVRSVHLSVLVISTFLVVSADLTAVKSAFRSLGDADFQRLHRNHSFLSKCLVLFWMSGLFLVWRGTGFELEQFSPKLIAKIAVVALLTANAVAIGKFALPYMERNQGMTFGQFSFPVRMRLAGSAGVSSASWISAFCLGALPWLKTASAEELIAFIGPIYAVCFVGACCVAMLSAFVKPGSDILEVAALDDSPFQDMPQSAVIPGE